jgi:hypothetical protein
MGPIGDWGNRNLSVTRNPLKLNKKPPPEVVLFKDYEVRNKLIYMISFISKRTTSLFKTLTSISIDIGFFSS